jgi:AcrR family transcriptional regulator
MSVADTSGLEALSMRMLGEELGVSTMSLYRYVPGKPELLDLMLELAYAELPQELAQGDWPTRLGRVARDTWELHLRHPWMLEVSLYRASLGPYSIYKYERELSAVEGIGLSDLEMDLMVAAVSDCVRGAASRAVEARDAGQATGRSNDEWWALHSSFLQELVDPNVFPLAVRIGAKAGAEYGGTTDPALAFEFGLECLIQGLQDLLESRSTGR